MSTRNIEPPEGAFRARPRIPADKSLSHRAFIFSGLARGTSRVAASGTGADVASTIAVLRELGVQVEGSGVDSPGVGGWQASTGLLDCGNSGTTLRLLAGALAGRPFRSVLTGDESLRLRPMARLEAPLRALGATVETAGGRAPVTVGSRAPLRGASVELALASAQLRSSFELAAIQAEGSSEVDSPPGFRDHTERWLETLGLGARLSATRFRIDPGPVPPAEYRVPADPSSAAFLWAAAAAMPGASVTVEEVSLNPGRIGFLQVLEDMGAQIDAEVTGTLLGDPVGRVTVTGHGLFATEVSGSLVAATLDELPLVGVLGALAEGITTVRDAAELRAKESDRIASTVAMIRALGGGAEAMEDGFAVVGVGRLEGGEADAAGDHRIAMAAAVAAVRAESTVRVRGAHVAAVSWPEFFDELERTWSSR